MAIPATVGIGFRLLRTLRNKDIQAASELSTRDGRKRIARLFASPADPRTQAILARDGTAQGRVQGTRGVCRFAELPDRRVALLDLVLERGGWRLDDVRIVESSEYGDFGRLDEGPTGVIG